MAENVVPPDYVLFQNNERESFLSQISNFSYSQRNLFHLMCVNWDPVISYDTVERKVLENNNIKDLNNLMEKLKKVKLGLLVTKIEKGERSYDGVVLSDEDSDFFNSHLIAELYRDILVNYDTSFPTVDYVNSEDLELPLERFHNLNKDQYCSSFIEEQAGKNNLYKLVVDQGSPLLVCSQSLSLLLSCARFKIRHSLLNLDAITNIARVKHCSLKDLNDGIRANKALFWQDLTNTIITSKESLDIKKVDVLDESFYKAVHVLHLFIENEILSARNKKNSELKRAEEMKTIVEKVGKSSAFLVNQNKMSQLIKDSYYGSRENYSIFKEKFYEKYTKINEKGLLPAVVFVDKKYIHRENIFPCFKQDYTFVSDELETEYQELFSNFLRHGSQRKDQALYSLEAFNNDIKRRVLIKSPFIGALLQRPRILAEAIIANDKKKNFETIKKSLSFYFEEDKIEFRPLDQVFNLNSEKLLEWAMTHLSIWRQFFLRLTGRYSIYREEAKSLNSLAAKTQKKYERGTVVQRSTEGNHSSVITTHRSYSRGNPPRARKKVYTKTDQDKAWNEFYNSLK